MNIEIYCGNPPENISQWINQHYNENGYTVVTYSDGTSDRKWITSINNNTFDQSKKQNAVSIKIGNIVTEIGSDSFSGYANATGDLIIPNNVVSIGKGAFYMCESLNRVVFGNSVQYIEESAFTSCRGLTEVVFDNSLKSIGPSAFNVCASIQSIEIPPSVTTLHGDAFANCHALRQVVMNEGVKTISRAAFYNTALSSLTIPNSVTTIGEISLGACQNLTVVTFNGKTTEQVRQMDDFSWGAQNGTVFHCTDGDIVV